MATVTKDFASRNGVKGTVLTSTIAHGTAPLQVSSSTVVTNLNADLLDGVQGSAFALKSGDLSQFAATSSSTLRSLLSDETGTGLAVFGTSPTISTSLITDSTSFDLFNTTATTINFGGAATTLNVGNAAGTVTIAGNLTVNGTTTTINSTTITVDDKNIVLGDVTSPTNVTADGGGISLKGATDKTFNWVNATSAWTSSEHMDLASGKAYYINGASVLNATTLGSAVVNSSLTKVGALSGGTAGFVKVDASGNLTSDSNTYLTTGSSLNAANLTGTIPSAVLGNSTVYIGTTAVALNRGSANLALTGITSIDGTASKATNLVGGNGTTLLGSIPYQSGVDTTTLLAPNTTTSKRFLRMTGTGTNGAAPAWDSIVDGDIPSALTGKTYNALTLTALATGFSVAGGTSSKTLTVSNTLTFTGTDSSSVAFGAGGTVVYTSNKLSVHAATTSDELRGVISDETGSGGGLVFATGPTLTTPVIDAVVSSAGGATNALWSATTTGSIAIGAGLTTGALNIAAVGTGATPITIGHTNATLAVTTAGFNLTTAGALTLSSTIAASGLAGSLLSSANPVALGTAGPGTSAIPSRQDHVHPTTGIAKVNYQTTAPGTPSVGDIWIDSDEVLTTLNSNDYALKSYVDGLAAAGQFNGMFFLGGLG